MEGLGGEIKRLGRGRDMKGARRKRGMDRSMRQFGHKGAFKEGEMGSMKYIGKG